MNFSVIQSVLLLVLEALWNIGWVGGTSKMTCDGKETWGGKLPHFPPLTPSWHCHSMHQTTTHSIYRPFFTTGLIENTRKFTLSGSCSQIDKNCRCVIDLQFLWKNWRERMSTGAGDHNISVYQDKKRIDATMNQEEKIDGKEWRILERLFI